MSAGGVTQRRARRSATTSGGVKMAVLALAAGLVAWVPVAPEGAAAPPANTDDVPAATPEGLLMMQDRAAEATPLPRLPLAQSRVARLGLGLGTGLGSPLGYFGASIELQPWPWFALQAGIGVGGQFGPATSEMMRFSLPLGSIRQGLGIGLSQNYLVRSRDYDGYAGAPDVAQFLNLEMFFDVFASRHFALRLAGGVGILLNGGDYTTMCQRDVSACTARSAGADPWRAGVAAYKADTYVLGYGGVDLLWLFDLGSSKETPWIRVRDDPATSRARWLRRSAPHGRGRRRGRGPGGRGSPTRNSRPAAPARWRPQTTSRRGAPRRR